MKYISNIILMAVLTIIMLPACTKDSDTGSIVDGEWHTVMTVPDSETAEEENAAEEIVADVYVSFSEGRFVLYQKTGSLQRYYIYTGSFAVDGDVLTGCYDDGTPLGTGHGYKVSVKEDVLTMTAQNFSGEVTTYRKKAVPAEVKDNAVPNVKSAEAAPLPLL